MEPAKDHLAPNIDPELMKKAYEWWHWTCPEWVKCDCSITTILALFAQSLRHGSEN